MNVSTQPLAEFLEREADRLATVETANSYDRVRRGMRHLARIYGIHDRELFRIINAPTITWHKADRLAGIFGVHPFDIWGSEWSAAADQGVLDDELQQAVRRMKAEQAQRRHQERKKQRARERSNA